MKFFKTYILFFIFLFTGSVSISAQCTVNAGGNTTICGTTLTLDGSTSGNSVGNPTWTLVSKPAGAPDPVISNINAYKPNVTGMTYPGNYVFRISQNCNSSVVHNEVTILAPGEVSTFTAGPDIVNVSAITGVATLTGVIPAGYTAQWTYYNIQSYESSSSIVTTNATMSNTTTASPTLTLTNKSNHNVDPAYRVVLRITSINNPDCWYQDDAIVRFIPNPQLLFNSIYDACIASATTYHFFDVTSASPRFATTTANSSGNTAFGTTIQMNVISQPAGGNIAYYSLENARLYFSGINVIGSYVFTLRIANANGIYTTSQITYNYNGIKPQVVGFVNSAYPEQVDYGAVFCNRAGSTNPITLAFKINSVDPPSVITTVANAGIVPPGGSPVISAIGGAGTMDRTVTLTPPAGGWRVGTYRLTFNISNGLCNTSQPYYVHISDGTRPNVSVNSTTVCYPGSGAVTATVSLPAIYKGVINSSYFQDFSGYYDITLVSKPSGSATPTYDANNLRSITNTSTVINNLDKPGEYVFKIRSTVNGSSAQAYLNKEYACSGTSLEGTFSVFVSPQVNSNAGSDQAVICNTAVTLAGNNPTPGTGAWTVVSAPSGATPVFANATLYNTAVTGMTLPGTYTLRWTITTGTCTSSDVVDVVIAACPTISGTVFNDLNANTVIDSGESGISAGTSYVYLVNSSGVIVNSTAVASNGAYSINVGINQNYTLHLSSGVYTIGTNTSTTPINHTIPGWVNIGENKNNNTGSGDGTPDGIISATVVTSSFTNYNFGVRACPAGTEPPVLNSKTT